MATDAREIVSETVLSTELESDAPDNSRRVHFVARLTSLLGVTLFVLLAIEGVSIPFISQLFTWHVVVGILLIPIMAAKIIVTSYRFALYYARSADFKKAGPPWTPLRVIGPLLVITTVIMMVSGVMLMVVGPYGSARNLWFIIHRASFIAWFAFMALHVLAYLLRASNTSLADLRRLRSLAPSVSTDAWYRLMILTVTLGLGIGLASHFGPLITPWLQSFAARRVG